MRITCNRAKREQTLLDRGLDFHDARIVFEGQTLNWRDDRFDYGEPRMITVGFLAGRMVVIAWTPRGTARRIISMRKANEREQKKYRQQLAQG